jgi:hypothetical protein
MFKFQIPARIAKLERRALDLQAELQAKDRVIAVLQAEIDQLSIVLARDRSRVESELAHFARARAESEGTHGLHE